MIIAKYSRNWHDLRFSCNYFQLPVIFDFHLSNWATTNTVTFHSDAHTYSRSTCKSNAKMLLLFVACYFFSLDPLSYLTVEHIKCNIQFICLWICSKPAKRSTFSATRWTATFMDKCRIDRGIASRVEQENDHEPSVASIWHTVQFIVDVRSRKVW